MKFKKVTTKKQVGKLTDWMAKTNERKYNLTKAAEELNELAAVLLKTANKRPDYQPGKEDIIEETGDVVFRINIVLKQEGITREDIFQRVLDKGNELIESINEGKYKKGV